MSLPAEYEVCLNNTPVDDPVRSEYVRRWRTYQPLVPGAPLNGPFTREVIQPP